MTTTNPIYKECFSGRISAQGAFTKLRGKTGDKPDFSIREEASLETALGRLASFIMLPLYPAQSPLAKRLISKLNPAHLDHIRRLDQTEIDSEGTHFTLPVTIERNGVRYQGLLMGKKENLTNGKWVLQAMGRDSPIERAARKCRTVYSAGGYNVLMVNGPSIGRSEGTATPRTLGEAHEAALQFLETAIQAKNIVIAGHSIGGAVVGQAILQHRFDPKRNYLVIRQSTFDRVSNAVKHFVPVLKNAAEQAILMSGVEMDNLAASKRLEDLGIPEVIVQTTWRPVPADQTPRPTDFICDGVIHGKATLGHGLVQAGILGKKQFSCISGLKHTQKDKYLAASLAAMNAHFNKPTRLIQKLASLIK